ncbi:winged helix-turn-helix transcriptional regulator [Lactiplantibacillus carotarum]|uniref:winged helix-turn-helix transcriptional regulator n=1 Tax=Lactiplantibacillus carotarum TaxID=2993456 RepID=UPI00298ED94D|nr:helix-turn-helix domain-containing protein [Lactiplantibacillus carotarum]
MTDSARQYAQDKLNKKDFDCAKEYTLAMFSGKYKIVILYHLFHDGTMRFNQIQRLLKDATHKMLTQQLKEMCADGLVMRSEQMVDNRKAVFYHYNGNWQ